MQKHFCGQFYCFHEGKNIRWYRRLVDLPNEFDKATRQIESSNIHDQVASFDSIANAQTDMICHYDEVVNFDSIPGNQNDSFLSLFLLFFQNFYFLTFDFEIRGCVMFSNTSQMFYKCSIDFLSEVSQRVTRQKWVCITELRRRGKD